MAKIEVKILEKEVPGITFKNIADQNKISIITEYLTDNMIVTVILMHSKPALQLEAFDNKYFENLLFNIIFSVDALTNYLLKSGDKNSIHFGVNPVIPGLMILEKISEKLKHNFTIFNIKFINPLLLSSKLNIFEITNNKLIGTANEHLIFKLKIYV